jgi:hypothetical protein
MKGYLYTLEVLIAVSIVFGAVFLVYRSPPPKPDAQIAMIKQQGFESLRYLDDQGLLRKYVNESNETAIKNSLQNSLTKNIGFEIAICTTSCDTIGVPDNQTIILVDYYISGYRNSFDPKKIRLYLWGSY